MISFMALLISMCLITLKTLITLSRYKKKMNIIIPIMHRSPVMLFKVGFVGKMNEIVFNNKIEFLMIKSEDPIKGK